MNNDHQDLIQFRNWVFYVFGGVMLTLISVGILFMVIYKLFEAFPESSIRILLAIACLVILLEALLLFRNSRSYSHGVKEGLGMVSDYQAVLARTLRAPSTASVNPATLTPDQRASFFNEVVQGSPTSEEVKNGPEGWGSRFPPTMFPQFMMKTTSPTTAPVNKRPQTIVEVGQSSRDEVVDG